MPQYCDVSVPVPLEASFTYALPDTLQRRAQPGCRVIVPFGPRRLTGIILSCHDQAPPVEARPVQRLVDEEPALSPELLKLGLWIAGYYAAPPGETLRGMLPLAADLRRAKIVSLTPSGQEAARQLPILPSDEDPVIQILRALDARPLREEWLKRRFPLAVRSLPALERKGLVTIERVEAPRDPLRARSGRLMIELDGGGAAPARPSLAERGLLDFLKLNPGSHDLAGLAAQFRGAEQAARRLAKGGALRMWRIAPETPVAPAQAVPPSLNAEQQAALEAVSESLRAGGFRAFLLHGVTGSGKTEVYLRAIEVTLALGRSALLLVPEIALTPAMASQFYGRFGESVAILHSAFGDVERADQWRRIRQGRAHVVVGTRSGVYAPVANLGLVVVDEEHDQSYKQQETPRYHGRDVALVRAQAAGATALLGSATPGLESRHNAEKGKYALLELRERIEKRPLPRVDLIDMRLEFVETRKTSLFSRRLIESVEARLAASEQVMILLNRRGFSTFVACRACGERIECRNCSVTLTYHRREQRLLCHYCEYTQPVPSDCPKCGSEHIYFLGSGSEKVEEALHQLLPRARIGRLDRDTARGRRRYETILDAFREGSLDILVGTQMIAKGHDIPNVTLVGVVSADVGLGLPDFRSAERTFQLLTQVAGRAGRGDLPGQVLIQTINPEHYAIRFAAAQDYAGFYGQELHYRRVMHYPPFTALASVLVRSERHEEALKLSGMLGQFFKDPPETVRITGPGAAHMLRLKGEYRYQFVIRAWSRRALGELLKAARKHAETHRWPATALVVDVDPMSLL